MKWNLVALKSKSPKKKKNKKKNEEDKTQNSSHIFLAFPFELNGDYAAATERLLSPIFEVCRRRPIFDTLLKEFYFWGLILIFLKKINFNDNTSTSFAINKFLY